MPRSGIYKCLNNSELAYYFAGRVACQPLFFRHSAWGQYGGDAYATAEGVEPIPTGQRRVSCFRQNLGLVITFPSPLRKGGFHNLLFIRKASNARD